MDVEFCDMLKTTCNAIIHVTTCNGCIATFSLHGTSFLIVSLFYGKCYVTIVIGELSRFSNRYLGNFPLKWGEIVSNHFFFIENVGFYFCLFPSFFESIVFFWSVSFRYILYFFWVVNGLTGFIGFAIYFFFHSYEKT